MTELLPYMTELLPFDHVVKKIFHLNKMSRYIAIHIPYFLE